MGLIPAYLERIDPCLPGEDRSLLTWRGSIPAYLERIDPCLPVAVKSLRTREMQSFVQTVFVFKKRKKKHVLQMMYCTEGMRFFEQHFA